MRRAKPQKAPAYQWYPKDFMSDGAVMAMSLAQEGLYRRLLDVCWLEKGLPMRSHELWRIGHCESLGQFEELWPLIAPKFYEKDGKLHHKRLDEERRKQAKNRKQRHLAAERRWELEREARNAGALRETSIASPSPSSIAAAASKKKTPRAAKPDRSQLLMEAWNGIVTRPLPACEELSVDRRRKANARLDEKPIEVWREVIQRIETSVFCRGQNDRGWRADFDFLLKPGTAAKVLEGKYDDRKRVEREAPFTAREQENARNVRRAWMGCRHEPLCETTQACLTAIMRSMRGSAEGAA